MLLTCDRCKKRTHKLERCDYCSKLVCYSCIKSSRRIRKVKRLVICKDCWGIMERRKKFKTITKDDIII